MQFLPYPNRKERKERRDKDLWCFFFATFAFFVVNPALVAAGRAGLLAPFSRPVDSIASRGLVRKWLIARALQESAFFRIFPLTFLAYRLYWP